LQRADRKISRRQNTGGRADFYVILCKIKSKLREYRYNYSILAKSAQKIGKKFETK